VRKQFAGARAKLIDGTEITFQEDASLFIAFENQAFLFRFRGVIAQELLLFQAEFVGDALDVAVRELGGGHSAAVRACLAVNGVLDLLGDGLESALNEVMTAHPRAEALVLVALLFAEAFNLHEVRQHGILIPSSLQQRLRSLLPVSQQNRFCRKCSGAAIQPGTMADNSGVTDQLSLSIWLEGGRSHPLRQHFETMLRLFPFSQRAQPLSTLTIHAIGTVEPPLLERPMTGPVDVEDVLAVLKDYDSRDVAYRLESWWDLWQYDRDWALKPTRVILSCFGADFDNGTGEEIQDQEDLRIDFGVDAHYLPQPEIPGSARLMESNIKSLLRLVHEVENSLPIKKRVLGTESGENFADRLQRLLTGVNTTM
jgi:hypothetical protein